MPYGRLRQALREQLPEIVSQWEEAFDHSWLRMPRPGIDQRLVPSITAVVESLLLVLPAPTRPDSPLREQSVSIRGHSADVKDSMTGATEVPGIRNQEYRIRSQVVNTSEQVDVCVDRAHQEQEDGVRPPLPAGITGTEDHATGGGAGSGSGSKPGNSFFIPGAPAMRELEKNVAFAGATMAGYGVSGFDVAAFIISLREVLRRYVDADQVAEFIQLFEWLTVLAMDAFSNAATMGVREHARQQLEQGTPVVLVAPRVPAALLVGDPDARTLDAIFSRLVLLRTVYDAPAVIIDATGLANPTAPAVLDALSRLASHDKVSGSVEILVVGLEAEQVHLWIGTARRVDASLTVAERFRDAVAAVLARAGLAVGSC